KRRVLVLHPTTPMLEGCLAHDLTPALGTARDVRRWVHLSPRPFHLGVDTGMNRGGVWWEEVAALASDIGDAPGLEGALTHFHSAEKDEKSAREQWQRFQQATGTLARRPKLLHAANSAAALSLPELAADMVRPGIFLYGGVVGAHQPKPVVTWKARICR